MQHYKFFEGWVRKDEWEGYESFRDFEICLLIMMHKTRPDYPEDCVKVMVTIENDEA